MSSNGMKIAVVGGGLAGLAAAMKIAEAGHAVDLFSVVPVKRSHSVCAQGGINGAVNTKGEGDSTWVHFDDTIYGGDFLANQRRVTRLPAFRRHQTPSHCICGRLYGSATSLRAR